MASKLLETVQQLKDTTSLSAVVTSTGATLKRAGHEWKACCPLHDDRTPSFFIYDGDRRFQCFGCNAEGDVFDFIRLTHNVDLAGAVAILGGGDFIRLSNRPSTERPKGNTGEFARRLWREGVRIVGTPAAAYLHSRGIAPELPDTVLRFARLSPPKDSDVLAANGPAKLPALLALVTGPDNEPSGIHRIFLTDAGGKAKAADGKVKFSLGNVKTGAVRLTSANAQLTVAEGIEDALSLMAMGAPAAWAAGGAGMLSAMVFPDEVRSIVVGADNDQPGRKAAKQARDRFLAQGKEVRAIYPTPPHKDFNEELIGDLK